VSWKSSDELCLAIFLWKFSRKTDKKEKYSLLFFALVFLQKNDK